MSKHDSNLISRLAGLLPGAGVSHAPAKRAALPDEVDKTYDALFDADFAGDIPGNEQSGNEQSGIEQSGNEQSGNNRSGPELPAPDRSFVAAFLALLQGEEATSEHYIFLLHCVGSPLADLALLLWIEAAGASLPGPMAAIPAGHCLTKIWTGQATGFRIICAARSDPG